MKENILVVHGGAPTAVMNASLYGVIREAEKYPNIDHIYAAIGGSGGILKEHFLDLKTIEKDKIESLPYTPASAIGTSRDALEKEDYEQIADVIQKNKIRYVFMNGGNGSMDTCGKIYHACKEKKYDVIVVGIPKTIDNDLAITDHSPGFGSAARYIAGTVNEICQDIRALPIHVCVIEAMGRNAGWIAAASALAAGKDENGPDLIYVPERAFDEDAFLEDVQRIHEKKGGVVVVASEGLKTKDGTPIVEPIFTMGRATYYGDVSAHLANVVIQKLGIKSRSEKPGICGRASAMFQSSVDREEAILAGKEAVCAAMEEKTGIMIGFQRTNDTIYQVKPIEIPIENVMMYENCLPDKYINSSENGVTQEEAKETKSIQGKITKIAQTVIDGNSHYYLMLEDSDAIYDVSVADIIDVIKCELGEQVTVTYKEDKDVNTVTKLDIGEKAKDKTSSDKIEKETGTQE